MHSGWNLSKAKKTWVEARGNKPQPRPGMVDRLFDDFTPFSSAIDRKCTLKAGGKEA